MYNQFTVIYYTLFNADYGKVIMCTVYLYFVVSQQAKYTVPHFSLNPWHEIQESPR